MPLRKILGNYETVVEQEMSAITGNPEVSLFYDPIRYMLSLKGKRIRPLLTILCGLIFGSDVSKLRFSAAAVELLHSFTLVHDDIMDNDETRRGKPTIHVKWDLGTAILAGDGLMGLAFQKLLASPAGDQAAMARRFTETMIVICEGQGLDKMFEKTERVSREAYLNMIACKTAVLLELACELGGMVASAEHEDLQRLREYGYALGMAFQIRDDLLDVIADEDQLGKKTGSDLLMKKKTILTILLAEITNNQDFFDLPLDEFKKLLQQHSVLEQVEEMYQDYFTAAYLKLEELPRNEHTQNLRLLTDMIRDRDW